MGISYKKLTRESRTDQSRTIILQAATELLIETGYQGFTINRLIEYMGGSKKTIYKYFENRDGLVLAIIDNQMIKVTQSLEDLSLLEMDLSEGLNYIGVKVLDVVMVRDFLHFRKLILHEAIEKPELGHEFIENVSSRSYGLLAEFLDKHIEKGNLKPLDPLRLARHFWAMMLHYQMTLVEFRAKEKMSKAEIRTHVRETVDDFILAFGA